MCICHMHICMCMCMCAYVVCIRTSVCVDREVTNILIDDTQLTIQQGGVVNCPDWKGDSKCLDVPQDSDGDEHQQSAFCQWHCQ